MKEKDIYLKAMARRDDLVRRCVVFLKMSKAATGRKFGISRERVRQIVNGK